MQPHPYVSPLSDPFSLVSNRGFTIIELLVVVAIIGLLASIAIPSFNSYRQRAFDAATLSDARTVVIVASASIEESTPDYLCGGTADCKTYAPELVTSSSTSSVCWEVVDGELNRFCACSRLGTVRSFCSELNVDPPTMNSNDDCPCPVEP